MPYVALITGVLLVLLTVSVSEDATPASAPPSETTGSRSASSAALFFPSHVDPAADPRPIVQITPAATAPTPPRVIVTTPAPEPVTLPPSVTAPEPAVTAPAPEPDPEPIILPTPAPTSTITPAPANTSWGVFAGSNQASVAEFESYIAPNPDYLAYFVHWGNGGGALPTWLQGAAADRGRTLVLFWEASDFIIGGTNQPAYAYRNILAGDFDDYFDDFYSQLQAYRGDVILVPFSELNGNWSPWGGTVNGNTPAEAVAAFRKVYRQFSPLPNVQIGLALNAASVPNTPENALANYYPGDAFVDIVGVDGFNGINGAWLSFEEIFGNALRTLSRYNKPVMIFSYASGEGPNKADWLYDMYYTQLPKHPYVTGWVYFNQNKELNWLIWSDADALEVFEDTVEYLDEN